LKTKPAVTSYVKAGSNRRYNNTKLHEYQTPPTHRPFRSPGLDGSARHRIIGGLPEAESIMDRQTAWELLCEHTKSDSLRKHALAVEACLRAYARKFGEDEEMWGIVGLIHDFDYEIYPNAPDHPLNGSEILKERGVSEEVRRAILGHADYSGVPRDTLLAKTLFACDEVAGFITACTLVRPDRIASLEAKSMRKRMKDKAFARSVSREDITRGAEELGVPLDEHITFCITAMRNIADQLGLDPAPGRALV
jgi:putative nucleotidyltransferase with HDIG domain